jgi:hypothetical protein
MSNLNAGYAYEVVVSYTISGETLEDFVEQFKFKNDKYVVSVQRIDKDDSAHCCPEATEVTGSSYCVCSII